LPVSSNSLFCITRDPFLPWKRAEKVWRQAKRKGYEVVVALDSRTSAQDTLRVRDVADKVVLWESPGYCEAALNLVRHCSGEFVLKIDDDEEPSPLLWRLGLEPPLRARYGIPVIPVLGRQMYQPDIGIQERLFYREGWSWVGGFEGHSEGARQIYLNKNPGAVVWHYLLEAPREEREAKAARYNSISAGDHRSRVIYEDHPELLTPIPEHLRRFLPNG
jgi:hypothetical protein